MIANFSVITREGLTTLAHSSKMCWTITSGSRNHLRDKWEPTPETLSRIQVSCKAQEYLEESNKLTPSRHILLALREIWDLERSVTTGSHGTRFLPISIQERGVLVGNTGSEDDICAGLHGWPRQTNLNVHPPGNRELGGVENQGQNLDTHSEETRLPPTPILQPRREGKHQWLQNQRENHKTL